VITVIGMCMVMHSAAIVVIDMRDDDKKSSGKQ
jgi:hypothetical protein